MENIRSGNLLVKKMKKEIEDDVLKLRFSYITKRAKRQILDGTRFLEMIENQPYRACRTVSELKKKISEERNKIKEDIVKVDCYMPGHQFTIFEMVEQISKEEQKEMEKKKEEYVAELHWLHKCLGICSNKNYFK